MPAYVRWRRGLAYEKKHLLSRFELARGFRAAGLRRLPVPPPGSVGAADLERAGPTQRAAARAYGLVRRMPLVRSLVILVFPALLAVARRPGAPEPAA